MDTDLSRSLWVEETAFSGALGGSLMLDVSESLTLRLFQSDFFLTTFGDDTQLSEPVSTGLVVKPGSM